MNCSGCKSVAIINGSAHCAAPSCPRHIEHMDEAVKQLAAVTAERDKLKAERKQMEKQEQSDTYIQTVPDKCDRIMWRNKYYSLPIAHPPVPDGKVLVPIEPTEAIAEAFDECWRSECVFAETYWEAMLKAAQGE